MERMYGTTIETSLNMYGRIVGREKSRNTRPAPTDGVDILVVRYATCPLELVDVEEKTEDGVGRQIEQGRRLSPANIIGTRRTRHHVTGERADFIAKVVATGDTTR